MKYVALFISFVSMISCSPAGEQSSEDVTSDKVAEEIIETDTITDETPSNNPPLEDLENLAKDGVLIDFEDLKILIDTLDIWEDGPIIQASDKDTAWVILGLGYGVEDRSFQLFYDHLSELKIYQSYETSMQVMREGPHCDLVNWKHYKSDWTELTVINELVQTKGYSEDEWSAFIEVDMAEAIEEVRKECGDEWAEHAATANAPTDYPCGVSINAIYFRIEYLLLGEDNITTKYLAFHIPMGC